METLDAYAADCRVHGHVELGERRMTDMLNGTPELHVQDARLESLENGRTVAAPEITIAYDELCAVVANGTRGDWERRLRTHATRIEIDLGPYHIEGAVHGTPASDPLSSALRRASWVPVTQATVRYRSGTGAQNDEVETLIVNRDLATLFRAIEEVSVPLPWETPRTTSPPVVRALNLTGTFYEEPRDRAEDDRSRAEDPAI